MGFYHHPPSAVQLGLDESAVNVTRWERCVYLNIFVLREADFTKRMKQVKQREQNGTIISTFSNTNISRNYKHIQVQVFGQLCTEIVFFLYVLFWRHMNCLHLLLMMQQSPCSSNQYIRSYVVSAIPDPTWLRLRYEVYHYNRKKTLVRIVVLLVGLNVCRFFQMWQIIHYHQQVVHTRVTKEVLLTDRHKSGTGGLP